MSTSRGTDGRPIPALLLGLVAAVTGLVVIPNPTTIPDQPAALAAPGDSPGSSKAGTASIGLPTAGGDDPRRPFQEFWETAGPDAGNAFADDLVQRRDLIDMRFLIAAVPDPIDSRFGYRFDAVIDDIQMGIESLGWNLDRYWLPWWPSGTQPGRRDNLKPILVPDPSTEKVSRLELVLPGGLAVAGRYDLPSPSDAFDKPGAKTPLHEREPGVLIFRTPRDIGEKAAKTQQMLIVFLVGERPTSGVHKAAMGKAIHIIERFTRRTAPRHDRWKTVRFDIVGPYFTGSERSLSRVIQDWTDRQLERFWPDGLLPNRLPLWEFKIRSGASNRIVPEKFREDSGNDSQGPVQIHFDGTVHYFNHVLEGLFNYLRKLNGEKHLGKVALLTESDTEYGKGIEIPTRLSKGVFGVKVTQMKFPFHISEVAIAYDQNREAADRKAPPPVLLRPSSKLRIPFDETGSPRDTVPSLSPAMTAASDEFDTAKILETISMEDYRYVGIVATDTRDVIFLAGLIRDYCPDVQLFSFTGDLLLGHPTYAPQLRGMIVASTYPMFSMAQRWDPPHKGDTQRHLFMHEVDQGYYNATVSLLGQRIDEQAGPNGGEPSRYFDHLYDYGKPFDQMDDLVVDVPKPDPDSDRPPIWFGVIGQRGIWPVTYDTSSWPMADEGNAFLFRPGPGAEADPIRRPGPGASDEEVSKWAQQFIPLVPQFTWVWGTLVLLVCAGAWSALLWHWAAALRRNEPGGFADLFRPYGAEGRSSSSEDSLRFSQEFFAHGLLAALLMVHCYFVLRPCRLTLRHSPWRLFFPFVYFDQLPWGDKWNWFFGLVAIFLGGASTVALIGAIVIRVYLAKPGEPGRERESARWGWVVLGSVLLVVLLAGRGISGQGDDPTIAPVRPVRIVTWVVLGTAVLLLAGLSIRPVSAAATEVPRDATGRSVRLRVLVPLPLTVWLLTLAIGVYLDPPSLYSGLLTQAVDAGIVAVASWAIGRRLARSEPLSRSESESRNLLERARQELRTVPPVDRDSAADRVRTARRAHRQARNRLAVSTAWGVVAIPALAGLGLLGVEVLFTAHEGPYDSLLFLERAINPGNGVSPEVPVFLLGLAAGAWLLCQLRRVDLIHRVSIDRLADPAGEELALSLDRAPACAMARTRKDRLIALGRQTRRPIAAFLLPVQTSPGSLMILGLSLVFVLRLYERFVPTVDGLAYNRGMILSFSLLIVTVVVTLCRFLMVWSRVRSFLRELALLPMTRAFADVPRSLSHGFGSYLNFRSIRLQNLEIPVRQWARVADGFGEPGAPGMAVQDEIARGLGDEASGPIDPAQIGELAQAIEGPPQWRAEPWAELYRRPGDRILRKFEDECADPEKNARVSTSEVRAGLRRSAAACLSVLFPYWASRSIQEGYGESPSDKSQDVADDAAGEPRSVRRSDDQGGGRARRADRRALLQALSRTTTLSTGGPASSAAVESTSTAVAVVPVIEDLEPEARPDVCPPATSRGQWTEPATRWFQQAEDLVALQMVDFLMECMIHLKNLVGYLAVGPFLLMLAATSYPFQPQRYLVVVIWMLLILVAASVVWAYIQMERDEVLSRIAKTRPNEIEFSASFLGRIGAILIPIAGVLLAQFPSVSDTIAQFVDPIIRVLK